MIQLTKRDGKAWPIAFDWKNENGENIRVNIDRVLSCAPYAEQKSGTVGDRYECVIEDRIEYIYYGIVQPRKWFKVQPVNEEEYNRYYKLPKNS
jgi:hypothetical protein